MFAHRTATLRSRRMVIRSPVGRWNATATRSPMISAPLSIIGVSMRRLLPLALLLASCSEGAVGPAGPAGPPGPEGPPGGTAEVASLRAELAAVKAELAMVSAARVKAPHLIAEDGSDLGPFAGFDRYWNADVGAYVAIKATGVLFAGANCTGEAAVPVPTTLTHAIGPSGTVLALSDRVLFRSASALYPIGQCVEQTREEDARPFTDTGVRATAPSASHVEPR